MLIEFNSSEDMVPLFAHHHAPVCLGVDVGKSFLPLFPLSLSLSLFPFLSLHLLT